MVLSRICKQPAWKCHRKELHQEIIPLLESNESGFTDALLATSAIMRFSEYNGDDGITREELNVFQK